ncbi:hypothetical protein [Burkholderia multivorans]|uniref:hypothetical protein n=1 Tax=Burkholderia multivorans TaxID=87883 RepID=UPI000CFEBA17|nr:hypothetical protein [Burkholderia multivorans]PRF93165.1 hypothetical protein C6Q23_05485 [Burkholderia multivorans]
MALPHPNISQIPNNEPDAVPSLWNTRYQEIDENFADHESRLAARETELNNARGGKANLAARLTEMDSNIGATSVDMQNATAAALKFALDQAALANYSVRALREQAQQEGVVTIKNRGIVKGCSVSKSTTAARNLNITSGVCFANGRAYSVSDGNNAASVPSNIGSSSVVVYAYLFQDANGLWRLAVTPIGTTVPDGAIIIYNLTIPANSTDATDPNLTGVAMTDVRRIEAQFPQLLNSPASVSPALQTLGANDYSLSFDVVSADGAPCDSRHIVVASRATNGFSVYLASAADNVVLRWRASKLNN